MEGRRMLRALSKKRLVAALVSAGLVLQLASCGTILHPERRGQPPGRLDPGIVLLDAVGLVLFFVPGIIAFAVDFSNGTIYLPPEYGAAPLPEIHELRTVRMSPAELTPERVAEVVREQTGRSVRLEAGGYRATRLDQLDDFSDATLERLREAGGAARVAFPTDEERPSQK
jgi:hypothetical protein